MTISGPSRDAFFVILGTIIIYFKRREIIGWIRRRGTRKG